MEHMQAHASILNNIAMAYATNISEFMCKNLKTSLDALPYALHDVIYVYLLLKLKTTIICNKLYYINGE